VRCMKKKLKRSERSGWRNAQAVETASSTWRNAAKYVLHTVQEAGSVPRGLLPRSQTGAKNQCVATTQSDQSIGFPRSKALIRSVQPQDELTVYLTFILDSAKSAYSTRFFVFFRISADGPEVDSWLDDHIAALAVPCGLQPTKLEIVARPV
jgi:hypothetical protein